MNRYRHHAVSIFKPRLWLLLDKWLKKIITVMQSLFDPRFGF